MIFVECQQEESIAMSADVETTQNLDTLHHVAISVKHVGEAVEWYRQTFRCEVTYQDETWAMLKFANVSLALVIPEQHPPHLGFFTPKAAEYGPLKTHRDGTRSLYISDPAGNAVELLAMDDTDEAPGAGHLDQVI